MFIGYHSGHCVLLGAFSFCWTSTGDRVRPKETPFRAQWPVDKCKQGRMWSRSALQSALRPRPAAVHLALHYGRYIQAAVQMLPKVASDGKGSRYCPIAGMTLRIAVLNVHKVHQKALVTPRAWQLITPAPT